ncbi:hypothetical protein GOODEAATRI_033834 [Goodea atripinnis]|uniref:Secreted protein n=1 Tax=Goodea atripinnis TaxID=208336 RepID=A0ABV0PJ91_9TELE
MSCLGLVSSSTFALHECGCPSSAVGIKVLGFNGPHLCKVIFGCESSRKVNAMCLACVKKGNEVCSKTSETEWGTFNVSGWHRTISAVCFTASAAADHACKQAGKLPATASSFFE